MTRHYVLAGGTASGKKAVALELARRHGFPLLSMDSVKVYRGMDIGTDKPPPERRGERGFRLLDLVGHDQRFSAGDWLRAAAQEVERAAGPVLVAGGTTLYLRLLLRGLCPSPPGDPELREQLRRLWESDGGVEARRQLATLDPEAAARLLPGDAKRQLRALEVAQLTGVPLSTWQREHTAPVVPGDFRVAALRRPAAEELERVQRRVTGMLEAGLLREVEALAAAAPFAREPAAAIGYAEALAVLAGRLPAGLLAERIVVRTRQLTRKQRQHLAQLAPESWVDLPAHTGLEAAVAAVERAFGL
ncbi:MAG TPA: tRNA (adenosine(37)-N6)-dimethylallyltransferase MiaA [Planctomycetota bacterium]|nr:tRNA (adenosine(37)-N6)-dimethylallyltransferase MiaA [Planctomycetota bacterium]